MQLTKYQEVILRDVQNPNYERQRRWIWPMFGFFGVLFIAFYFILFAPGLRKFFGFVLAMYQRSLVSTDQGFKDAVYVYQYMLLFSAFVGLVAVFTVLAFYAFDIQIRNEIIRKILHEQDQRSTAPASPNADS